MKLKTKNKSIDIYEAITFKERLIGLIGKTNINYGLLFKNCNSIHTFMMKESIDIIGIDENNKIIYIYQNLIPNKIIKIKNPQNKTSILELPKDTSKYFKLNEILTFEK